MNDEIQLLLGKLLIQGQSGIKNIQESEFKVFSQFGDDGIIQFLINRVKPIYPFFIEFGVENYLESNTRFLLQNNNWSGLVMDGSSANIEAIKKAPFYWKHDLIAHQSFVTAENINTLLIENLPTRNIGLLHIDIDGNDYWVWKAIDCILPQIVIVEYNSVFGYERSITVPYDPYFLRTNFHYSNLYAGSSLKALFNLAIEKGYQFVGSNTAGNNAYFVRNDCINNDLKSLTVEEGYVESKFRESRDKNGQLTFLRGRERLNLIKGLPVYNTESGKIEIL